MLDGVIPTFIAERPPGEGGLFVYYRFGTIVLYGNHAPTLVV